MSDIELIINIPDTAYQGILNANNAGGNWNDDLLGVLCRGVANGTPLPKGHGKIGDLDALREEVSSWGMNDYEPSDFIDAIDQADAIIEADNESEDEG